MAFLQFGMCEIKTRIFLIFLFTGAERRQCDGDGTWGGGASVETPRCLLHWCPAPPKVEGSVLDSTLDRALKAKTEVKYECQKGYTLFGEAVSRTG